MAKKKSTPAHIKRHWNSVAELGCIISGSPYPTIHHPHGGSMNDIGVRRGGSQKTNDWLVIPLRFDYHVGSMGIDSGIPWLSVREWEKRFGTQVSMIDKICVQLNVNVWEKAGIDRSVAGVD